MNFWLLKLIEHLTRKLWELKIAPYSNFFDFSRIFAIFYNQLLLNYTIQSILKYYEYKQYILGTLSARNSCNAL